MTPQEIAELREQVDWMREREQAILTDIAAAEDHHGDMDVATSSAPGGDEP